MDNYPGEPAHPAPKDPFDAWWDNSKSNGGTDEDCDCFACAMVAGTLDGTYCELCGDVCPAACLGEDGGDGGSGSDPGGDTGDTHDAGPGL